MNYQLLFPSQGLIGLHLRYDLTGVSPSGVVQVFEDRMLDDTEKLFSTAFALPVSRPALTHSFWSSMERERFILLDQWGNELHRSSTWISH